MSWSININMSSDNARRSIAGLRIGDARMARPSNARADRPMITDDGLLSPAFSPATSVLKSFIILEHLAFSLQPFLHRHRRFQLQLNLNIHPLCEFSQNNNEIMHRSTMHTINHTSGGQLGLRSRACGTAFPPRLAEGPQWTFLTASKSGSLWTEWCGRRRTTSALSACQGIGRGLGSLVKLEFTAIIEKGESWLVASCPEVPEANGQGRTRDEALDDLAVAIQSVFAYRRDQALAKGSPSP